VSLGTRMVERKTACCFSARKRLLGRVSRPIYWAARRSVYNQSAVTEHSLRLRPSLTELEHGRVTGSAPQGAGVTGTVESGRPGADGRAAGVRSDRPGKNPVLPESLVTESLRDSFHYGKNDIDLFARIIKLACGPIPIGLGGLRPPAGAGEQSAPA
jgi:hypothetical protein